MKRFVCLFVAAIMALLLCSCGKKYETVEAYRSRVESEMNTMVGPFYEALRDGTYEDTDEWYEKNFPKTFDEIYDEYSNELVAEFQKDKKQDEHREDYVAKGEALDAIFNDVQTELFGAIAGYMLSDAFSMS